MDDDNFIYLLTESIIWYTQVRSKATGAVYVIAESRMSQLPKEKVKTETIPNGSLSDVKNTKSKNKGSSSEKNSTEDSSYEVLEKIQGSSLVGLK